MNPNNPRPGRLAPRRRKAIMTSIGCALITAFVGSAGHGTVASAAAAPPVCSERAAGGDQVAFGLTADQRLICFKVERPWIRATLMRTRELVAPDTQLLGIDTRPATGEVYGLGDAGGIYVLDPTAAKPQLVSRMNVALEGRHVGMDFNPTVDRLRIVTDSGQNLRVNVTTGAATVDGFLRSGSARQQGVTGVAYTNNDADASTATTLYDLDTIGDQLMTQTPPNDGALVPVGRLGFAGSGPVAFDIMSTVANGKAVDNTAYAALGNGDTLFRIDLKTGTSTFVSDLVTPLLGLSFPI